MTASLVDFETELQTLENLWRRWSADPQRQSRIAFDVSLDRIARFSRDALAKACEADPERGGAHLALGAHDTHIASLARGGGTVDAVSQSDWKKINKAFEAADISLKRAIDLGFAPGAAYALLMRRQQVIGSRSAAERLFDDAVIKAPHWLSPWIAIQGIREPRWGGSLLDMDALLAQARLHLNADDIAELTVRHWVWRSNYAMVWDKDYDEAVAFADKGLAIKNISPDERASLFSAKSDAYFYGDREDRALDALRSAVELRPCAHYFKQLGDRLAYLERFEDAALAYQSGAAHDGDDAFSCAQKIGDLFAYDSKSKGVGKNRDRAIAGYARALALADQDAQKRRCYNAIGLEWSKVWPTDFSRAEDFFAQGAALGDRACAANLADLLIERPQHDNLSALRINDLLRLAANQGDRAAMQKLTRRLAADASQDPRESAQEAHKWRFILASYGDVEALGEQQALLEQSGEERGAEAAAWIAAAESNNDLTPARKLVQSLMAGRYGPVNEPLVFEIAKNALLDNAPRLYDADLLVSLAILEYNIAAPAARDPRMLAPNLKQARQSAQSVMARLIAERWDPGSEQAKEILRLRALNAEITSIISKLPGVGFTPALWRWISAPFRCVMKIFIGPKKWPRLSRPGWAEPLQEP